jgi:hypothetical protein
MGKQRNRKVIKAELNEMMINDEADMAELAYYFDEIIFGSHETFLDTLEKAFSLQEATKHRNPIYNQVASKLNFDPLA